MKKSQICNYVNVALMAFMLLLQFLPFWKLDGGSKSIQSYIWFPTDNSHVTSYLTSQLGDTYNINNIIWVPIIILVAAAVGIIMSIWKSDYPIVSLIPMVCGLVGAWGYMAKPALQLGSNWMLHLIVCIGMVLVSVLTLVFAQKHD